MKRKKMKKKCDQNLGKNLSYSQEKNNHFAWAFRLSNTSQDVSNPSSLLCQKKLKLGNPPPSPLSEKLEIDWLPSPLVGSIICEHPLAYAPSLNWIMCTIRKLLKSSGTDMNTWKHIYSRISIFPILFFIPEYLANQWNTFFKLYFVNKNHEKLNMINICQVLLLSKRRDDKSKFGKTLYN